MHVPSSEQREEAEIMVGRVHVYGRIEQAPPAGNGGAGMGGTRTRGVRPSSGVRLSRGAHRPATRAAWRRPSERASQGNWCRAASARARAESDEPVSTAMPSGGGAWAQL